MLEVPLAPPHRVGTRMMINPGMQMIFGYVRNVDYPVQEPWSRKLPQRVALVMQAKARKDVEYHFDTDLLLALLKVILDTVTHDAVQFEFKSQKLHSLDQLRAHYAAQPVVCREPFSRGMLSHNDEPAAALCIRRNLHDDAKPPYQKSYTLVAHMSSVDQQQLMADCRRACAGTGCEWIEPLQASPKPQISVWQRVHDFIAYDVEHEEA